MSQHISRRAALAAGASLVLAPSLAGSAHGQETDVGPSRLSRIGLAFEQAAWAHGVPHEVLVSLAYTLSRMRNCVGAYGGHGVMQLRDTAGGGTLSAAAEAAGRPVEAVREQPAANIDGAAAWLRSLADDAGLSRTDRGWLESWYEPVTAYSGIPDAAVARLEADAVFAVLARGLVVETEHGRVRVEPRAEPFTLAAPAPSLQAAAIDYPSARWVAANSSNYRTQNRPNDYRIDRVVIHTTQGSYAGAISWFQNPGSNVSAHYVIRSSDGQVTQMVRHKNVAWHAGNDNNRSIGIEHEGWVDDASWYTEEMYRASAAVTRFVCKRYGIPIDRTHIVAHSEVPGATHTDPGPNWDWNRYLRYVRGDSDAGWSVTVDNDGAGFSASDSWERVTTSGRGGSHRHAKPLLQSDVAWFSANIPSGGRYRVDVWYPQSDGNNPRAPYIVAARGGFQTVYMDQRSGGGRWNSIGVFELDGGRQRVVGVSRWTGAEGWIEADAVRISEI